MSPKDRGWPASYPGSSSLLFDTAFFIDETQ
jgi:hypothetical protein